MARPGHLVIAEFLFRQENRRGDVRRIEHAVGADVNRALIAELAVADLLLDRYRRAGGAVVPGQAHALDGHLGAGKEVADLAIEAPATGVRRAAFSADRQRR